MSAAVLPAPLAPLVERDDDPLLRDPPFLENGELLDQPTFHALYERMPEDFHAELIGGVVYVASPVSREHSDSDSLLAAWLVNYRAKTPGLASGTNGTVILGNGTEVQPDLHLRIRGSHGGSVDDRGKYLAGPPELVLEVSVSSRSRDLHGKRDAYFQAGVLEYVVVLASSAKVLWHVRGDGGYRLLAPDADGLLKSPLFGGLWLDPAALAADDPVALLAALDKGLASPAHAATVARMA